MSNRTSPDSTFAKRTAFYLVLSLILAGNPVSVSAKNAHSKQQPASGNSNRNKSLEQRIKALEAQVGSVDNGGSLEERLSALEAKIGKSGSNSLPPVAPAFNKNAENKTAVAKEQTLSGQNENPSLADNKPAAQEKATANLKEAIKLYNSGQTAESEVLFKKVLAESPYNADACYSLGTIAEAKGELTTALGYYNTAALANPCDTESQKAVKEIQERIALQQPAAFKNPLDANSNILQARAIDFGSADSTLSARNLPPSYGRQSPYMAPTNQVPPAQQRRSRHRGQRNPIPTLGINQQNPAPTIGVNQQRSPTAGIVTPVARGIGNIALRYALQGTGLHCPMGQLFRGF